MPEFVEFPHGLLKVYTDGHKIAHGIDNATPWANFADYVPGQNDAPLLGL